MEISDDPPALELDCGVIYKGDDERLLALAFMTPDEGQAAVRSES